MEIIPLTLLAIAVSTGVSTLFYIAWLADQDKKKLKRRLISNQKHVVIVAYGRWWNRFYIQCKDIDSAIVISDKLRYDKETNVVIETTYYND